MRRDFPARSTILFTCAALACVLSGGCQESWQADTYPTRGELFINGQPASGAFVTLHPVGEQVDKRESRPWGFVQEDGSYAVRTYEAGDGAPAGDYRVTFVWRFDPFGQAATDRLGFVYSKPENSQWTVTIKPDQNDLPKIELMDVKVAKAPPQGKQGPSPLDTE